MNIIIVGCGKVGRTLAEELNEEDNNITVIDTDAAKVKALSEMTDVMGIVVRTTPSIARLSHLRLPKWRNILMWMASSLT